MYTKDFKKTIEQTFAYHVCDSACLHNLSIYNNIVHTQRLCIIYKLDARSPDKCESSESTCIRNYVTYLFALCVHARPCWPFTLCVVYNSLRLFFSYDPDEVGRVNLMCVYGVRDVQFLRDYFVLKLKKEN